MSYGLAQVKEYVEYFKRTRPHQGIEQRIPEEIQSNKNTGKILAFPVLNGLHYNYKRAA
jgi:hypothetical protein